MSKEEIGKIIPERKRDRKGQRDRDRQTEK
jgi:hypothetical protein